jgi:hypothetical protein
MRIKNFNLLTLIFLLVFSTNTLGADKKISELDALSQSSWATGDLFPMVDVSAGATKKTTVADFDSRYLAQATIQVWVNGSRTDSYTPDGTALRPYKTIDAANDAITDASTSKRYALIIAPGVYVEDNSLVLKPWIYWVGFGRENTKIRRTDSSAITMAFTTNTSYRGGIKDLEISSALTLSRSGSTTAGGTFEIDNCTITGAFTFSGIGAANDFAAFRGNRFIGSVTANAIGGYIKGSSLESNLNIGTTGGLNAISGYMNALSIYHNEVYGNVAYTAATGHGSFYEIVATPVFGTMSLTASGTGTISFFHDAISIPSASGSLTTSGTVTRTAYTRAHGIRYVATTSGDWAVVPTTVTAALDQLTKNVTGDSGSGGAKGLVPAPASGDAAAGKFLKADGTWAVPSLSGGTTSEVFVQGQNGYGSTNTKVPRFVTAHVNTGSDITYADSATNGASFTINTSGVYALSYTGSWNSGVDVAGITKNSAALTSNVDTEFVNNPSKVIIAQYANSGDGNVPVTASATAYLTAGDVIRPHTRGSALGTGSNDYSMFRIVRVK